MSLFNQRVSCDMHKDSFKTNKQKNISQAHIKRKRFNLKPCEHEMHHQTGSSLQQQTAGL